MKRTEVTHYVEPETLRQWLDSHRPVTVLDVRGDDDRAQWAIPESGALEGTLLDIGAGIGFAQIRWTLIRYLFCSTHWLVLRLHARTAPS